MWKVISCLRKTRCTNFTGCVKVFSTSKTTVGRNPSNLIRLTDGNKVSIRETNDSHGTLDQQNIFFNIQQRYFRTSMNLWEEIIVSAPIFPESITEGDVKWLKAVGDKVATDEVVCEIETDKTAIAVPSPGNGVIVEIYAKDGDAVKYKQQLFKLKLEAGTGVPVKKPTPPGPEPSKPVQKPTPAMVPQVKPTTPIPPTPAPTKPTEALPAKPLVQRKEIPTQVKQPYPIHSAVIKVPPQDPTKEISGTRTEYRVKMTRMRQKIAGRLKEAQNTAAMLTTFNEIDMSKIISFRKSNQDLFTKKHGIKLGFMSAFIKASSYALQDQPVVNAVIDGTDIVYRDYVDISVAVATPKGLVVPVLRNVQNMNFADIENGILQLGEKARKGKLAIEDMDGGTFTISNGGVFGSLMGTPIINPPQSAILGMHATVERPVAIKQEVVIRPMMYVALTYDHRLIDGREAVLFLRKIKAAVEDPTVMFAGL